MFNSRRNSITFQRHHTSQHIKKFKAHISQISLNIKPSRLTSQHRSYKMDIRHLQRKRHIIKFNIAVMFTIMKIITVVMFTTILTNRMLSHHLSPWRQMLNIIKSLEISTNHQKKVPKKKFLAIHILLQNLMPTLVVFISQISKETKKIIKIIFMLSHRVRQMLMLHL